MLPSETAAAPASDLKATGRWDGKTVPGPTPAQIAAMPVPVAAAILACQQIEARAAIAKSWASVGKRLAAEQAGRLLPKGDMPDAWRDIHAELAAPVAGESAIAGRGLAITIGSAA